MAYTQRRRKLNNTKVIVNGIEFDSIKEGRRYSDLLIMQKAGEISNLELQKKFTLIPSQRGDDGKVIERAVQYVADFAYLDRDGRQVVEDVKGYRNPSQSVYAMYVIKRKLMLYVHGIRIIEV